MIDVESLLVPLSWDAPCGEDLEYDPAFWELERASEGRPEQQVGDSIVPAEEADWGLVRRAALDLFPRTRDLRVAVLLTKALIRNEGWPGFSDGLAVIDGLIERYWGGVHPQLDPDDDNDPTLRVNWVASLADPATTLVYLRDAPLVESVMGRFSLRDLMIVSGELDYPADSDAPPPDSQAVEAAFMAADVDALLSISAAIADSAERLGMVENRLLDLVGQVNSPNLSALVSLIEQAGRELGSYLALRPGAGSSGVPRSYPPPRSASARATAGDESAAGLESALQAQVTVPRGRIVSRNDVRRAIEEICEYYRNHEASSPVPILLERAKRLIDRDFIETLRDLTPDGAGVVETPRGPKGEG